MPTGSESVPSGRTPTDEVKELRKFCNALATILALACIAIGYLIATSGRLGDSISVSKADFEALNRHTNTLEATVDVLEKRLQTSITEVHGTLSALLEKVNSGDFNRTYSGGGSVVISEDRDGPYLRLSGPGKSGVFIGFTPKKSPLIQVYDMNGKGRLNIGLNSEMPYLGMRDVDGKMRVKLSTYNSESLQAEVPSLDMFDVNGKSRLQLGVSTGGSYCLFAVPQAGVNQVFCGKEQ